MHLMEGSGYERAAPSGDQIGSGIGGDGNDGPSVIIAAFGASFRNPNTGEAE
jgi:hypothetical protein